jgi:signal transduction histidine kinase/CheY-like chemotaxis protein
VKPSAHRAIALLAASLSMTIALGALAAWIAAAPGITSLASGLPRMVPATAFVVVICALGLAASLTRHHLIAGASGLAVFAAGIAIELFWYAGRVASPFTFPMSGHDDPLAISSPVTAAMAIAIGSSMLLQRPRSIKLAQSVAIGVLLLSLLTLAGFIFRGTVLYDMLPGRGTSILTAASFALLATSLLCMHSGKGIMVAVCGPMPSARAVRRLLLATLAFPLVLGIGAISAMSSGLADPSSVVSVLIWSTIVLFTFVILRFAMQLYQLDSARSEAEGARNEALDALRAADLRKDEFLAMLAHEMRNPLAPISAAAELLRRTASPDPAQLKRTSEIISRQVGHMVHLVDDLLDVSRVTRGQIKLEMHTVDLRAVITDAVEQARPLLQARRHKLDLVLDPEAVLVAGDHKRLVQVVANLLNNAARYTPPGGHVELRMAVSGEEVELQVRDSGIGIEPALIPHVFELFTQAKRSADRSEGGLGLGLALVRSLTELQGGRVRAASEGPGRGSTFFVTLPRLPDTTPISTLPQHAGVEAGPRKCLDVLVVDDNIDAANALAALLGADCHEVVVEHSSEAALEKARNGRFDACLIDIGLPGMDGNELARTLRSLPATRQTLLVAVTGYGAQANRFSAMSAGFDHYFVKPVQPELLTAVLSNCASSDEGG